MDNSLKDSASSSDAPPLESEFTRPVEGESDSSTKTDPGPHISKVKDGKPYSPKASTSLSKPHSEGEKKKSVDVKEESIKDEKNKKTSIKKGLKCGEKMEVDLVKEEIKKEKSEDGQMTKSSRPSSTPPSNTGWIFPQYICLLVTVIISVTNIKHYLTTMLLCSCSLLCKKVKNSNCI